jgi:hypothetical protein
MPKILFYKQTLITVQIKEEFPTIKIIGFSDGGECSKDRVLGFGASSYLSKYDTGLNQLITEIKSCITTEKVFKRMLNY